MCAKTAQYHNTNPTTDPLNQLYTHKPNLIGADMGRGADNSRGVIARMGTTGLVTRQPCSPQTSCYVTFMTSLYASL